MFKRSRSLRPRDSFPFPLFFNNLSFVFRERRPRVRGRLERGKHRKCLASYPRIDYAITIATSTPCAAQALAVVLPTCDWTRVVIIVSLNRLMPANPSAFWQRERLAPNWKNMSVRKRWHTHSSHDTLWLSAIQMIIIIIQWFGYNLNCRYLTNCRNKPIVKPLATYWQRLGKAAGLAIRRCHGSLEGYACKSW
jgi:hypothetical protein